MDADDDAGCPKPLHERVQLPLAIDTSLNAEACGRGCCLARDASAGEILVTANAAAVGLRQEARRRSCSVCGGYI